MRQRTKWLVALLLGVPLTGGLVLVYLARNYASRIEPYLRDQAVLYLRDRFQADVAIGSLRIDIPALSPVKLFLSKGRGVRASVHGESIVLNQQNRPLLSIGSLRFDVDLGELQEPHKGVRSVLLDNVRIHIPPKGSRPRMAAPKGQPPDVRIDEIVLTNGRLTIQSKDPSRQPLEFEIHRIRFTEAGLAAPLRYTAELHNPKPPGEIHATGHFGPWNREEPGETALDGDFTFEKADLSVFSGIAGILHSTGRFDGRLSEINATGEATVPDFSLKTSGNKLPLTVRYEVQVDGTNGNTILKPVHGRIGKTSFVTSGSVVKHDDDPRRTIALDVNMPAGRLEDVLLLAMKGSDPFMSGEIRLRSRVLLPPLTGRVVEKLRLNGDFSIHDAKFLRSQLQDRLDRMSRQAQGQPNNQAIDEVASDMGGKFQLASELLTLSGLAFSIPGADLKLDGTYNLASEELDFHGDLRLQARLSQTQSGWKRWALKPVDPFFAKKGAGLYTRIQITGTRQDPKFGREK